MSREPDRYRTATAGTTLIDELARAGVESHGTVTFATGAGWQTLQWTECFDRALKVARALQDAGFGRGSRVGVIGDSTCDLIITIEAIWLSGSTLVILPSSRRRRAVEDIIVDAVHMATISELSLLIVGDEINAWLPTEALPCPVVRMNRIINHRARSPNLASTVTTADIATIQFTSGSTTTPKPVMVPHRAVVANVRGIAASAGLSADDVWVSWLPLFHDMGLVGFFLTPLLTGASLILMSPEQFIAHPASWFDAIAHGRATVTGAPNFAYGVAARTFRPGISLDSLRLAFNGAEPIQPGTVTAFLGAGRAAGLATESMYCVYGLAEATLGVSFPEPGSGMSVDYVEAATLGTAFRAAPVSALSSASQFVSVGRAIEGVDVRIRPASGGPIDAERVVGEIEVGGACVMAGYFGDVGMIDRPVVDGWLRTSDLGYIYEEELYVCGRLKDIVIVGGRNILPQDVERAAESVSGVRVGNTVAFGIQQENGRELLVIVAEVKDDSKMVSRNIAQAVLKSVGVSLADVVLVRPGSLPKTSSGKLQRALCRERYVAGSLR